MDKFSKANLNNLLLLSLNRQCGLQFCFSVLNCIEIMLGHIVAQLF